MLIEKRVSGAIIRGLVVSATLLFTTAFVCFFALASFAAISGTGNAAGILEFAGRWAIGALTAFVVLGLGGAVALTVFSSKTDTSKGLSTVYALGALPMPIAWMAISGALGQTPAWDLLLLAVLLVSYVFAVRGLLAVSISRAESKSAARAASLQI